VDQALGIDPCCTELVENVSVHVGTFYAFWNFCGSSFLFLNLCVYYKKKYTNLGGEIFSFLLILHLRPANIPTIKVVALCRNNFGHP